MSLSAAVRIGRKLLRTAFWHEGRCTWIGPARHADQSDRQTVYESLAPDLYAGAAGISWFLAHLFSATGDAAFRRGALGAIRYSLATSGRVRRDERLSFYVGELGIAFIAVELARRLDAEELEKQAVTMLRRLSADGANRSAFDLVTGTAGAMAALPILSVRLADTRLLEFAVALGERTIRRGESSEAGVSWRSSQRSRERNLVGLSHGTAGIAHGLLELHAATGNQAFRAAALEAFRYERSWFDAEAENWPDFRGITKRSRARRWPLVTYWCHGAPGIALSRIRAWELLNDDDSRSEALAAVRTTRASVASSRQMERDGFSVCHGLAGNSEVLLQAARFDPSQRRELTALARSGAREAERRATALRTDSPSLFTGLAGVGCVNLRVHDPGVPSMLLLRRDDFV